MSDKVLARLLVIAPLLTITITITSNVRQGPCLTACYCTIVNNNNNNEHQCQTTACYCTIVYNNNNNIDYHFQTGVAFCPVKRERACGI